MDDMVPQNPMLRLIEKAVDWTFLGNAKVVLEITSSTSFVYSLLNVRRHSVMYRKR
ncbi:MAG: hypothetical protein Q4D90_09945 [bacterium]|nr:hypothetical protein [bacterium]